MGMIFIYIVQCLCHRLNNRGDNSKPEPHTVPETYREEKETISAYQELDVRRRDVEDNYQSLRVNSRNVRNDEVIVENEPSYQGLNNVRENNDNNYQSLNYV